tara:strand:- start:223 stop:438 length:216 start_codon:yes stop_codon:yes gene_type:complete
MIHNRKDSPSLGWYVIGTNYDSYMLEASSEEDALNRANELKPWVWLDGSIKDVRLAKRSELKAIQEDFKHG